MRGQGPLIVLLLCLIFSTASPIAQTHALPPRVGGITLTDVMRLSQAGLSDNTIIAQIKMRPEPFTLSPDDLLQLKSAHVSDRVIEAMVGTTDPPVTTAASRVVPSPGHSDVAAPSAGPPPTTAGKPRVFVTGSESWEMRGSGGGSGGNWGASSAGGARPQTAEIIKTFGERCPEVTINNRQEIADYIVVLDHEGGKGYLRHRNKVAVFERLSGDVVISHSTLSLGGSVQDACEGIRAHWTAHSAEIRAAASR